MVQDVPAFIAWLRDHECITVHANTIHRLLDELFPDRKDPGSVPDALTLYEHVLAYRQQRDEQPQVIDERNEQDSIAAAQAQYPYIQPQTLTGEDTDNIKGQVMAAVAQKAKYGDMIYDIENCGYEPEYVSKLVHWAANKRRDGIDDVIEQQQQPKVIYVPLTRKKSG